MVRKHGDPNKYLAEVAHVAHDGDLVRKQAPLVARRGSARCPQTLLGA